MPLHWTESPVIVRVLSRFFQEWFERSIQFFPERRIGVVSAVCPHASVREFDFKFPFFPVEDKRVLESLLPFMQIQFAVQPAQQLFQFGIRHPAMYKPIFGGCFEKKKKPLRIFLIYNVEGMSSKLQRKKRTEVTISL